MVRIRLRNLVNIGLRSLSCGVANVVRVAVACGTCVLGAIAARPRSSARKTRAPSSWANCSPTPVSTAPPAWAGSLPTAPWSAPSGRGPRRGALRGIAGRDPPGEERRDVRAPERPADRAVFPGAADRPSPVPRVDLRPGFRLLRLLSAQSARADHQRPYRAGGRHHSRQAQAGGRITFIPSRAGRNERPVTHSRSSRNGLASTAKSPRPIVSIAAIMRPSRPSRRSASETMRMFGVAVGEARRSARGDALSRRDGD